MSRQAEDEGRFERREDDERDDVEAHHHGKAGRAMSEEPKADEDSSDEVEAHHHGKAGRAMNEEPKADDDSSDDVEAHARWT